MEPRAIEQLMAAVEQMQLRARSMAKSPRHRADAATSMGAPKSGFPRRRRRLPRQYVLVHHRQVFTSQQTHEQLIRLLVQNLQSLVP